MTVSSGGRWYDEAAGEPYADLGRRLGWDPLRPPETMTRRFARSLLGDGTRVVPIPLVLGHAEHRGQIQAGVAQRARALQQFFGDVVLADGRFLRGGTGLTESLLEGIVRSEGTSLRELREHWRGLPAEAIRFVYGPDLAREPSGRWVVLEDNVGCVSGCADSFLTLDAYANASGLSAPRRPDLAAAVTRWLDRLQLDPEDPDLVALLTDAHGARWTEGVRFDEDLRRQGIVRQLGMRVVDNPDLEQMAAASGSGLTGLRALLNIGVPSTQTWPMLLEAFFGPSRVPFFNAPGTSVLGNKALLPFVGDMIAFYLDEHVILDAPPTIVLRDGRLPEHAGEWVLKTAAGCGGDEVLQLRSQTPEQLRAIEGMLEHSWPTHASVGQRRVELSRLVSADDEYLVELRALGYTLGWQDVFAGEQCLATLTPLDEQSRHLHVAPVLTAAPDTAGVRA